MVNALRIQRLEVGQTRGDAVARVGKDVRLEIFVAEFLKPKSRDHNSQAVGSSIFNCNLQQRTLHLQ